MREPSTSGLVTKNNSGGHQYNQQQPQHTQLYAAGGHPRGVDPRVGGGGGPPGPPTTNQVGAGSIPATNNQLSLGQLQDMAMRQQHQIEAQQQMLVAKEQRLKYLRQQDFKQNQMAAEYERLRRLREKVRKKSPKVKNVF